MDDISVATTDGVEPVEQGVIADALAGEADRARHDGAAARVPALHVIEWQAPPEPPVPAPRLRIAAWNAERCKYAGESALLLREVGADIVLLSEVDIGMARSGNRHTVADLAGALGAGYAFAVEFVELGLGDDREKVWHAGAANTHGYHGNAILSELALEAPCRIALDDGASWFLPGADPAERRLGGRMAIAARVAGTPLWVVSVHLESNSTLQLRAEQGRRLVAALDRLAPGAPMVIGGDLNTADLPRGDRLPELALERPDETEPLFAIMAAAGFRWQGANDAAPTCRTRPDGTPLPPFTRIDWLFTRGVRPVACGTVPAVAPDGSAISDHDLVWVDLVLDEA